MPNFARARFDLRMRQILANPSVYPHGIVGQSWDGNTETAIHGATDDYHGTAEVTSSSQAEGAIEGSYMDYALDTPESTKFRFSRFDATSAPPRDRSTLSGMRTPINVEDPFGAGSDDSWTDVRLV
tara:strand:- start:5117 stop:5494 length:378 start_codon:yes stop_codon:yes gene_type:complete